MGRSGGSGTPVSPWLMEEVFIREANYRKRKASRRKEGPWVFDSQRMGPADMAGRVNKKLKDGGDSPKNYEQGVA